MKPMFPIWTAIVALVAAPALRADEDDDEEVAEASPKPEPRPRPKPRVQREWRGFDFDAPDFHFDFDFDASDFGRLGRDLGRLGERLGRDLGPLALLDRDDDDEGGRDLVREKLRRFREERRRQREHRSDDRPGAEASGESTARLAVSGNVSFQLRTQAAQVDVVAGKAGQVQVTLTHAPPTEVALRLFGDRVEAEFGGRRVLRRGHLKVELPPGARVDLQSMSGDFTVKGVGGDVRVRTLSGDVKVEGCAQADVQSISGDVSVEGASGPVRLQTVSGGAKVSEKGGAPQLSFASASGSLDWAGTCGKGCRLVTETVSGDVSLVLTESSSFALSFVSHSGQLDHAGLPIDIKRAPKKKHGGSGWVEATFGRGEGVIESDAFSGDLKLRRK